MRFAGELCERRTDSLSKACQSSALDRNFASDHPTVVPPLVSHVLGLPGQPLDESTRGSMERGFGHDFGQIRLHNDSLAAASARSLDADAYTVGSHIVFGAGTYQPGSAQGRRLLAHELAHTIQQKDLPDSSRSAISQPEDRSEVEALQAVDAVSSSRAPQLTSNHPKVLARQPAQQPGLLERAKARFYQGLIDSMRIPQKAAIDLLRRAASHLPDSVRGIVDTIIDVIEFVSGLVIQLIEAVVALNVGLVSGLVSLVEGLVRINLGLLKGMWLQTAAVVTGDFQPLLNWLKGIYEAIKGIPAGVKALVNSWLAEFKTASLDRQTIMIGELTGQIIALLLPMVLTGGGAAGGAAAGGVEAAETAAAAGTATELAGEAGAATEIATGASRVTSTGVRLTAISGGAGAAETGAEVATGASRVTSTGVRLTAISGGAGAAETGAEVATGASRVTSTGVRLTAISGGAGAAETGAEVATGASRVTSTGVRLSSVPALAEGGSATAGTAVARGGGAASEVVSAGARGPSAVLGTEGTSALQPLEVPVPEPPPMEVVPPVEVPAPVPATVPAPVPATVPAPVPASIPSTLESGAAAAKMGIGTKVAVGVGTAAGVAAAVAPKTKPKEKTCDFPTGLSESDPIPMVWYKVRTDDYYLPVLTLQGTNYYRDDPANPRTLPFGEPIGVPEEYWPHPGKTFQLLPESRGRAADDFRRVVRDRYGADLGGLQIDHVQDLQWEGPDIFENLWPLSSSANLSAGPGQNNNQRVSFCETPEGPPRQNVTLQQMKAERRHFGRWFSIGRIDRWFESSK